jgi:hypothetical protein
LKAGYLDDMCKKPHFVALRQNNQNKKRDRKTINILAMKSNKIYTEKSLNKEIEMIALFYNWEEYDNQKEVKILLDLQRLIIISQKQTIKIDLSSIQKFIQNGSDVTKTNQTLKDKILTNISDAINK